MHVVQFLPHLLVAVHIERVVASFPDSVPRFGVHRRRQAQPPEHSVTPRVSLVFSQRRQDVCRRPLFQLLDDLGSRVGRLRFEQHMEMFRHQNPAHQKEGELGPNDIQGCDKVLTEALAPKQRRPPISARRDEFELACRKAAGIVGLHGREYNSGSRPCHFNQT